jgi:F-box/TPR repeat protein Pof3
MGTRVPAEEGMGPMDKGRHRYAQGDYAGALVAFSEVSASHLVLLLFHTIPPFVQ